jgi:hypothetical protein
MAPNRQFHASALGSGARCRSPLAIGCSQDFVDALSSQHKASTREQSQRKLLKFKNVDDYVGSVNIVQYIDKELELEADMPAQLIWSTALVFEGSSVPSTFGVVEWFVKSQNPQGLYLFGQQSPSDATWVSNTAYHHCLRQTDLLITSKIFPAASAEELNNDTSMPQQHKIMETSVPYVGTILRIKLANQDIREGECLKHIIQDGVGRLRIRPLDPVDSMITTAITWCDETCILERICQENA